MTELNGTEIEKCRAFIERHEWRFAKSMPTMPHWYIVKGKLSLEHHPDFEWFVMFIREKGEKRKFSKTTYIYLRIEEFDYWTMGAPLSETIIINRALGEIWR